MRKLLYGICCLFLVALAASGLWAAKAINFGFEVQEAAPAASSQADGLGLQEMTSQSDLIITGQCLDLRSQWIEDGRVLVTLATISVGEVIKGDASSSVTVVLPGGIDANRQIPVAMTYPGAPQIGSQEEVFLFLTSEESVAGGYGITGFAEGKFSIVEDTEGQKLVSRDPSKVKVQKGPGVVRGNRQFTPLSEFKEKVKGYAGQ